MFTHPRNPRQNYADFACPLQKAGGQAPLEGRGECLVINTSSITETTVADSATSAVTAGATARAATAIAAATAAGRTVTAGLGIGGTTFTIPGTHITVTPGAIGTHTHTRIHR